MAALSYPGIYIQEFTPAPPIEAVGTSTTAFIGTAEKGPVGRPTRLSSWDAFQAAFGGLSADVPPATLAPALLGFFRNGGTDCFIVRAATAAHSTANLTTRNAAALPLIVVEAIEEGSRGDALNVDVTDASLLGRLLPGAQSALDVRRVTVNLGANPLSDARQTIAVPNNAVFDVGEPVAITTSGGGTTDHGVIASKLGTDRLRLAAPLSATTAAFSNGTLRSDDLTSGQTEIRVDVPAGFRLDRALPRGAVVRIVVGGGQPDIRTVDSTRVAGQTGTIVLSSPLARVHSLATAAPTVESLEFGLRVWRTGSAPETYDELSTNADHPRYWGREVTSQLVRLRDADPPPATPAADPRPAGAPATPIPLTGGADDNRATAWQDLLNDPSPQLETLKAYGEVDIVAIPGATSQAAQDALIDHCLELADRFAILDPEPRADIATIGVQAERVRARDGFAALYWPSILVRNPRTRRVEAWPPSGHLAGVYARTDATAGVHTAPANTPISGAIGLETRIGDLDQGPLNEAGINVLRVFPGNSAPVVWGARTTWLENPYWRYIPIRRLFLFLENSIERGIRWAVFQPNDEALWADLRRVIGAFLTQVWRNGALFGATPDEAFYVRADRALNPDDQRALGRLNVEIGVAPAYPAEFIVVRIGITADSAEITEG
jgi:Bacteriophage tail sheath protein